MRSSARTMLLQPKILEIRRRWAGDQDKITAETSRLYLEEDINPLAPLLPSFAQIPIFIALYRSITSLEEDPHFRENFFFIPSLAGPMFEKGYGLGWLTDDGMDIGTKGLYLIVPALLVAS